jgi:hypothetical protein
MEMITITQRIPNGNIMAEIGPISPKLLQEQVDELIDLIENDGDSTLWGIVHMLGDILDAADEKNEIVATV